jgi:glycosyltransferase involved in cell wall biosynthesis
MATTGGTERMISEKANYLSKIYGIDVTIITCLQHRYENNFFYLSKRIKQINLDLPYLLQYKYKYPKRLWAKWQQNKHLRESIIQTVNQENPDILIGVSRFKAHYISSIKCRAKKIIECHEVRYNTLYNVGEKTFLPTRVFMKVYQYFYFRTIERNADAVVTLTEEDKLLWKRAKHIEVIPNFSTMPICQHSDCTHKRVIAVGRLTWEKGFGRLIQIWTSVSSCHPDWHLDIYGEGDMHNTLKTLIKIYKTKNVAFHKFTPDISLEYATSSICAVTSYFEGFSLVLLEAMKHGVPCVAFDCPFGPRSIINDANCGFLVEDGDIRLFADRLCRLIENEELRKDFSKAAIEKAKTFDVDIIMNKSKSFYEQLVKEP